MHKSFFESNASENNLQYWFAKVASCFNFRPSNSPKSVNKHLEIYKEWLSTHKQKWMDYKTHIDTLEHHKSFVDVFAILSLNWRPALDIQI